MGREGSEARSEAQSFDIPLELTNSTSGWCRGSDRTSMRIARPRSTCRSTWSFTPVLFISLWPRTSAETIKLSWDFLNTLEKLQTTVNQSLLDLHKVAQDVNDAHFCDFLETEYLGEQVDAIKEISDLITKMIRAGDGLGLHTIDKELEA